MQLLLAVSEIPRSGWFADWMLGKRSLWQTPEKDHKTSSRWLPPVSTHFLDRWFEWQLSRRTTSRIETSPVISAGQLCPFTAGLCYISNVSQTYLVTVAELTVSRVLIWLISLWQSTEERSQNSALIIPRPNQLWANRHVYKTNTTSISGLFWYSCSLGVAIVPIENMAEKNAFWCVHWYLYWYWVLCRSWVKMGHQYLRISQIKKFNTKTHGKHVMYQLHQSDLIFSIFVT